MRSDELIATGELAADAFAGFTRHIRELHGGIAGRVFGSLGTTAEPVRVLHDALAETVYAAVGASGAVAVRASARLAAGAQPPAAASLDASPGGRLALGAVNGAFGDRLARRRSSLALAMDVRAEGRTVPLTPDALAAAHPGATPRLAVFLHGLCETEDAWSLRAGRHRPYGERLHAAAGFTPVYVRYNSGRHISENGRTLVALLAGLERAWPVPVAEIALIGHSMGGLVGRSACHYGAGSEAIGKVRHVFALGSPHRGAQLERIAHAAGAALNRLPETRAMSTALAIRSVGIRDLYHGYLVDEDWVDFDPDAFLVAAAREIPFLETASHYFVAATVTRDPDAPLGRAIGDLLVSRPSAWAQRRRTERLRFPIDNYRCVGGANHFDLLNHPAVAEQLVRWLAGRPALPAPAPV
jgi:hypothetical protein